MPQSPVVHYPFNSPRLLALSDMINRAVERHRATEKNTLITGVTKSGNKLRIRAQVIVGETEFALDVPKYSNRPVKVNTRNHFVSKIRLADVQADFDAYGAFGVIINTNHPELTDISFNALIANVLPQYAGLEFTLKKNLSTNAWYVDTTDSDAVEHGHISVNITDNTNDLASLTSGWAHADAGSHFLSMYKDTQYVSSIQSEVTGWYGESESWVGPNHNWGINTTLPPDTPVDRVEVLRVEIRPAPNGVADHTLSYYNFIAKRIGQSNFNIKIYTFNGQTGVTAILHDDGSLSAPNVSVAWDTNANALVLSTETTGGTITFELANTSTGAEVTTYYVTDFANTYPDHRPEVTHTVTTANAPIYLPTQAEVISSHYLTSLNKWIEPFSFNPACIEIVSIEAVNHHLGNTKMTYIYHGRENNPAIQRKGVRYYNRKELLAEEWQYAMGTASIRDVDGFISNYGDNVNYGLESDDFVLETLDMESSNERTLFRASETNPFFFGEINMADIYSTE